LAKLLYREVFDDTRRKALQDSSLNPRRSDSEIGYDEYAVRSLLHSSGISNCPFPELGDKGERKHPFAM
jgi:hypothetical protein